MKAWQLLRTKKQWTHGAVARDGEGKWTYTRSPTAKRWCLLGALLHCYEGHTEMEEKITMCYLTVGRSLSYWNDDPKRKFWEVKLLLKELDI